MRPSFDAVFEAEFPALHRYLRRRVGEAFADELTASTFAAAYESWARLDPERPLRPWLYGIAANLVRRHWREERRMLRAYARTGLDPVLAEESDAIDRIEAQARRRELAAALAELRPRDREIVLLRAWADLSDAEIAAALSLPIGTVKSRLHRTREQLRNRAWRCRAISTERLDRDARRLPDPIGDDHLRFTRSAGRGSSLPRPPRSRWRACSWA